MAKLAFIEKKYISGMSNVLPDTFKKLYKPGERVAVKLHMGEYGNINYLRPVYARAVVDALKEAGAKPFLFDSTTLYKRKRSTVEDYHETAKKHGYAEETMGCPIIISNEGIDVKTKHLDASVCKDIADADGMVVLTHVKGHSCSGFGGSIKNLGMGAVCTKTKGEIHEGASPIEKEGCIRCAKCVEVCPAKAIKLDKRLIIDLDACYGCSTCVLNCPVHALEPKVALFDTLLAEGAKAVLDKKKKEKVFYINLMIDISERCDCVSGPNALLVHNVGVLLGDDIVAIDQASIDLINKSAGKNVFDIRHQRQSDLHIIVAEKLKMGTRKYSVEKVPC